MGMHFSALLKSPRLEEIRDSAIEALEDSLPRGLVTFRNLMRERAYHFIDDGPSWVLTYPPSNTVGVVNVERPVRITPEVSFLPGAGFAG